MQELVLSSSVRIQQVAAAEFKVFNGINAQLTVPGDIAAFLQLFREPRTLESVLSDYPHISNLAGIVETFRNALVLVPSVPEDSRDMRVTWNCLAEGSEEDAAFVIDNETRTIQEFRVAGQEAVAAIDAIVALNPDWRVVNIGCGMGRIDLPLSGKVSEIFGFDVSDKMIARARMYLADHNNIHLARTDSSLIGVADDSIDLVISFLVFQHCPKHVTWSYLHESYRVLRRGGRCLFQILCYPHDQSSDTQGHSPVARYYGEGKPRYMTDEVEHHLAEAGFAVEFFRDGDHRGVERRLSGTASPHWRSKLVLATKT